MVPDVPTLLAAHGFDLVHSMTFSALTTLGAVPGALPAWPVSDRFGRKWSITVVAVAALTVGLFGPHTGKNVGGSRAARPGKDI